MVKNLPVIQQVQETQFQSLGQEDSLEEGIDTHSGILVWRILWTEEPGATVHGVAKELDVTQQLSRHTDIGVPILPHDNGFVSFRCKPRSGIAGSCGRSIFNFLMKFHVPFLSAISVYLPTKVYKACLSFIPLTAFALSCLFYFIMDILTDRR